MFPTMKRKDKKYRKSIKRQSLELRHYKMISFSINKPDDNNTGSKREATKIPLSLKLERYRRDVEHQFKDQ
jgi:hypothetical protein